MTVQRMDNVGIVVDDLAAAIAFFVELGLELDGEMRVEGRWADLVNAPSNALGIRRIMFAVDDIDDVLARLRAHGAELVGEVAQYEDIYRLCYVRGPEGIIVALAEKLR
jgi:catechol 2,3-dioxygenase-like lactoylglutathione lyase family enzyme